MSGRSDFQRDPKYWCKVHRRFFPYGRTKCLLCELDTTDVYAARRQRLVDFFPKGRVQQLMPPKPDRF